MAWVMAAAVLAAVAWGVSDFLAGLLSHRLPVLTVLLGSKVAGMLLALIVVAARAVPPPADPRLWLSVAAGLVGLPAMGLLYRAMRDGSLTVVAPVAAVAAMVPVCWGLLHGERFGPVAGLGVATALVGVTLAGWPVAQAGRRRRRSANVCALGAALGFGAYFVLLHEASGADQYWATAVARIAGGLTALTVAAALHRRGRGPAAGHRSAPVLVSSPHRFLRLPAASPTRRAANPRTLGPEQARPAGGGGKPAAARFRRPALSMGVAVLAVGAFDTVADAAFAVAAGGALGPAAMVSSMYPAVTVLLNGSVRRERLPAVHLYGVLATLLAVACLAG